MSNYGYQQLLKVKRHVKGLLKDRGKRNGGAINVGQWEVYPWLPRSDIVD